MSEAEPPVAPSPPPPPSSSPTIEQLRKAVATATAGAVEGQRAFTQQFARRSVEGQTAYAHLRGLQDHYKHKGGWSYFLMVVMAFMIWFQSYLLYKVGVGHWDFTKYEWLLPVLLVQNLAQVVGLAVFVVKALFRDIK